VSDSFFCDYIRYCDVTVGVPDLIYKNWTRHFKWCNITQKILIKSQIQLSDSIWGDVQQNEIVSGGCICDYVKYFFCDVTSVQMSDLILGNYIRKLNWCNITWKYLI
jgi:hypothetical protein